MKIYIKKDLKTCATLAKSNEYYKYLCLLFTELSNKDKIKYTNRIDYMKKIIYFVKRYF